MHADVGMTPARLVAFYAAMLVLTVLACGAITVAYFAYLGARLPRVPLRLTGDWLMERDDEIGFVATRNGATTIEAPGGGHGFHVYTDARSARVDAPGMQTPAHVDVMAVGCSFTWGAGVESEQAWPRQLSRILGVDVANLGMGSYGSVQAFQTMVRNADLTPKVVVYAFIENHLRRNLSPCAPNYVPFCLPVSYLEREGDWVVLRPPLMEYFSPDDNRAFSREVVLREDSGLLAWLLRAKWAAKITSFDYRGPQVADPDAHTMAAALRAIMQGMTDEAARMGAELVVLHVPNLPRGNVRPPPAALTSALAGKRVTLVDFSPVAAEFYAREPSGTLILGADDAHPNALAHRLIAEALAPVVRPLLALERAPAGPPA
jgi:hypothetical protein